jgi:hypothetical protein
MAPLLARLGLGRSGFGFDKIRKRIFGPPQVEYKVFYSPNTIDTSPYGIVNSIQYLSITSGSGGSPGGGSSPGGPEGPGGPGGPSGKVSYQEFIYGTAIVPQPINTSPPGSYSPVVSGPSPGNPSPSVISVPAPVAANYPGYTFTPSPNGTNGTQPQGWAGQGGYGGAGGIVITAPNVVGGPIPSVISGGGNTGGSAGGRPGGTGGSGASGYGAGGGGGGGGGEQDGDTAGGGPGGGGAPGIVIAKITYRNEIF